jgi:uncharacterized protein YndB with AHSA1/START domain
MIVLDAFIPAPRATVWECLTDNEHIRKWWGKGVLLRARSGGEFFEPWTDRLGRKHNTRGTITAYDPRERLQIDWKDESWPAATRVEFLLFSSEGGTKITIQHSGWEIFDDKTRGAIVNDHRDGWREIIENFTKYCTEVKI